MKKGLSRRKFLKDSILGMASISSLNLTPTLLSEASAAQNDFRIMVVVQLLGGLDPLMILPYTRQYGELKDIRGDEARVNPGDSPEIGQGLAYHPKMAGLANFLNNTFIALHSGVAFTTPPQRSHATMTKRLALGGSEKLYGNNGWTARLYDNGIDLIGLGGTGTSFNCSACERPPLRTSSFEDLNVSGADMSSQLGGTTHGKHIDSVLRELASMNPDRHVGKMEKVYRDAQLKMYETIDEIEKTLSYKTPLLSAYPTHPFGVKFRNIAQKALQLKNENKNERLVFVVSQGGFDMHSNWLGTGDKLMGYLGDTLTVFFNDLKAMGIFDNVVTMTTSEFGRTVKSNGKGTDHGIGFPGFVFGGKIKGAIHGYRRTVAELAKLPGNAFPREFAQERLIIDILENHLGVSGRTIFEDYSSIPKPAGYQLFA